MEPLSLLGLLLGVSVTSGIRLYATVAVLGLLHRHHVITLPVGLESLAHPWVIGIAAGLYAIEFVADKIPAVDSAWDLVHSFIRIPAASILAYAALAEVPEVWRVGAALLAGTLAFSAHGLKAGTRLAVNTSPEPVTNVGVSLAEDASVAGILWLAVAHPIGAIVVAAVVLVLGIVVARWLFRRLARLLRPSPSRAA